VAILDARGARRRCLGARVRLDLAMAFHAGNYNEASGRKAAREYVPEFILPAVDK